MLSSLCHHCVVAGQEGEGILGEGKGDGEGEDKGALLLSLSSAGRRQG